MKLKYLSSITLFVLVLTACQNSDNSQITDNSKVIATVGEFAVTEQYLDTYIKTKGMTTPSQPQKKQVLDEIVQLLALRHQAQQKGMQIPMDKLQAIEQIKHREEAQMAITDVLVKNPVTEEEIEAEYLKVTQELQGQEYHVHHLLYQDEVQALTVLDQIANGQSFVEAEEAYLSTLSQVKNVGDIGWVNIKQVPEAMREPLQSMTADEVYPQTVVSQFGVHILFLEAVRAAEAPAYETIKSGIRKTLEKQRIDRYKQLAVIKAKVKLHE